MLCEKGGNSLSYNYDLNDPKKALKNIVRKGNAGNQQFLLHPQFLLSNIIFKSHLLVDLTCHGEELALYLTILTFNDPEKETFENIVDKVENAGNQHFLLFPECFSTLS